MILHFAETYFGIDGRGGLSNPIGKRVFHVDIEGVRVLSNYDISAETGGVPMYALTKTFHVNLTDGNLTINFINVTNNAKISAIEIVPYIQEVFLSQSSLSVLAGSKDKVILKVEVPSVGSKSATSLTFNTNGTTNPADILKAKLYFSGTNNNFSNAVQIGTDVDTPNGNFTFTGFTQNMTEGNNYFWLTYDVKTNANVGNDLDAEFSSIKISSNNYVPAIASPAGARKIIQTDQNPGMTMDFNGTNEYIEIPNESHFDFTSTMTVEAWIKVDQFNKNWQAIVTKGDNSWRLHRFNNTNRVNFAINSGGSIRDISSSSSVNDGKWHHVAGVVNGTNMSLYVDGVLEATRNDAIAINNSSYPVMIGENAQATGRHFDGQIDEVRIWNIARTQPQIRENMHLISKGNETGLVAYWQFNETSGTQVYDWVGECIGVVKGNVSGSNRLSATEPVGSGVVSRTNSINGLVSFGSTGLNVTFGAVNPGGELVVTRLDNISPAGTDPAPLVNKSKSYWVIDNYGIKTGLSAMTLRFYLPDGFLLESNPSAYKLYKRASNSYEDWTDQYTASVVNVVDNYVEFTGITGFSQAIIAGSGVGLPIRLLSFEGKRLNAKEVKLEWKTVLEENNQGFEIERSTDNSNFTKIGYVDGAGNSSSLKSYQWIDGDAVKSAYYRLKQIDFDGKFEYTHTVYVEGNEEEYLKVYPNPVRDHLVLEIEISENLKDLEDIRMDIVSTNGTIMLRERGSIDKLKEKLNQQITGMYIIRFYTKEKIHTVKLVKN